MTPPRRTTPTSSEVAERAGVSRTTVSFVLNDIRTRGISEKTRQKVLATAKQLGYEPNASARSLARGLTGTVAVVIPRSDHMHVDAYLPRLLSAVNDRCHACGYKVLLESSGEAMKDSAKNPGWFMKLVKSQRIDGLIVVNARSSDFVYLRKLAQQGFPVVVPGHGVEPFYSRYSPQSDLVTARQATIHLIDLGHRQIAHLAFAAPEFAAVLMRRAGYEAALAERSIAPDPTLLAYADISAQSAYEAMRRMLAAGTRFTALFAGNDTIAFGAMRALTEAGYRIPQDIAVVGFDDIPLAAFASPPLTSVRTDPVTQGDESVDMLLAQIHGSPYSRLESAYDTQFVIRESCGYKARQQHA